MIVGLKKKRKKKKKVALLYSPVLGNHASFFLEYGRGDWLRHDFQSRLVRILSLSEALVAMETIRDGGLQGLCKYMDSDLDCTYVLYTWILYAFMRCRDMCLEIHTLYKVYRKGSTCELKRVDQATFTVEKWELVACKKYIITNLMAI